MSRAVGELAMIKEDTSKSKAGVAHLKNKIANNARTALTLMRKKKALQQLKELVETEILSFKMSLLKIRQLVSENQFV